MGLQPVSTAGYRVTLISTADSAINRQMSDLEQYVEDGYNLKHVTIEDDPESPPTWFTLRSLPRLTIGQLSSKSRSDDEFLRVLFAVACDDVTGLRGINHDTGEVFAVVPQWTNASGYKRLSDKTLEYLHPAVQHEMGEAAWQLCELGEHHLKNSSALAWSRPEFSEGSGSRASGANGTPASEPHSDAGDHQQNNHQTDTPEAGATKGQTGASAH